MSDNQFASLEFEFDGRLLHQSCLWGNTDLLTDLIFGDEAKYINSQDPQGRTALQAAVIANSTECARLLLMNGAATNIQQHDTKTALHLAAERGQLEMVQTLLEFNANIYAKDNAGQTALDLAVQGHHHLVIECLQTVAANHEAQRKEWYESFALAVHKGDMDRIRQLLLLAPDIPVDISQHDDGYRPKLVADFAFDNIAAAQQQPFRQVSNTPSDILLDDQHESTSKEISKLQKLPFLVNYAPAGSNTLLFKACQEGNWAIVKLLISLGADGRQHPTTKYSPLYIAAYHGRLKICRHLLENFPQLCSLYTVEHWLPVHAAALNNHQEIVELLFTFSYPSTVMKHFLINCDTTATPTTTTITTNKEIGSTSRSMSASNASKHDMSSFDQQFVYWMPFDVNAQDIASQSVLFLATLLANKMLVEFLLNFQLPAITYADYIRLFGHRLDEEETAVNEDSDQSTKLNPEQEFNHIFGIVDERRLSNDCNCETDGDDHGNYDEKNIADSGTSSSSEQDLVTIIDSNARKSKKAISETEKPEVGANRSPIRKLINKLSPSNPTVKHGLPTGQTKDKKPKKVHRRSKTRRKVKMDTKLAQLYTINPISLDLYGNYNTETALHCAVRKKHYAIAALLLAKGANPGLSMNVPMTTSSTAKPIVTRVTHFNHNLFSGSLNLSSSLKDLKALGGSGEENSVPEPDKTMESNLEASIAGGGQNVQHYQSNVLREAVKNRDKAMVDLLLRYGARDEIIGLEENFEEDEDEFVLEEDGRPGPRPPPPGPVNALSIAFSNCDFYFVSRLLNLSAFVDTEHKINKKAFDIVGSNCMNAMNKFNIINNVTVSSMYPTVAVMIDWSRLSIRSINGHFQRHLMQWLIDASLFYNAKLKLSQDTDGGLSNSWNTALAAITRLDLSGNQLTSVPLSLFVDLPSLRVLNLSKNRLQTLPEVSLAGPMGKTIDDETLGSLNRAGGNAETFFASGQSKRTFSKMKKSQSVNTALSTGKARSSLRTSRHKNTNRNNEDEMGWHLPCLEELYLQDNQLECLPTSLFQQPMLKVLDLSNNKLRTLPPLFWFAPKLLELNLSLNLLCDLPSPVSCLRPSSGAGESLSGSFDDSNSSRGICKSISESISLSDSASISSLGDCLAGGADSVGGGGLNRSSQGRSSESNQVNLIPFDLNLDKSWSGAVNILSDLYQTELDEQLGGGGGGVGGEDRETYSQCGEDVSITSEPSRSMLNPTGGLKTCVLTQLNLSHNGFDRVPFPLSCLATRLTHLNLSYNRLRSIFDVNYILGHLPLSVKHLDLSHNQIVDWLLINDQPPGSITPVIDTEDDVFGQQQWCYHLSSSDSVKKCPYKQHTRLDNLKTLILTNNHLKRLVITREEFMDMIHQQSNSQRVAELLASIKSNSQFYLSASPNANEPKSFTSRLAKKFYSTFGSMDDLASALDEDNNANGITINSKASRYTKLFYPNLSMLDVSNNILVEVPKTVSFLVQLSVLNISGNVGLTALPPEMGLLTKLWNLNTRGCTNLSEPLRSMIASKKYKTCDIISYLNSILENSKTYARLKLMLVGVQGIGKTSLMEALRHEGTGRRHRQPDHWGKRVGHKQMGMRTHRGVTLSTVGVDLYEWTYERKQLRSTRDRSLSTTRVSAFTAAPSTAKQGKGLLENDSLGPITFRTWDFGGQKEYYATHQYFLSKRSIYLVVWRIPDGEAGVAGLQSWLVNIQSRAPGSPVIIVGTHYDLIKEYYPPFYSSDLQNLIRDRYMSDCVDADKHGLPPVVASIEVSIKTRYNIRLLANIIYDTACEMRVPGTKERLLEQKVPLTYLVLEEVVGLLAHERRQAGLEPVLSAEQFRHDIVVTMRERHGLKFRDYAELQQATRFLHDHGVLLHYEDANLKELYFLDPQWLCDLLAHVVTIREINPFARHGLMKTDQLVELFKNTKSAPKDAQNYLLHLLNKFEVALTWDNRTLLIPSLLPTEEEELRRCEGDGGQVGGCDIVIPLRSRLNIRPTSAKKSEGNHCKLKFTNQLCFKELNTPAPVDASLEALGKVTAEARHQQSIHRILLLSYVPCGFWARLITRVLADEAVSEIVRSFYQPPSRADQLLSNAQPRWHCWQTGFGLRYFDTYLVRVKETSIHPLASSAGTENIGANNNNHNNNRQHSSPTCHGKSNYPYDYQKIKFQLRLQKDSSLTSNSGQAKSKGGSIDNISTTTTWSDVYISSQGSSMIEIYLPNQPLHVEMSGQGSDEADNNNTYTLQPNMVSLTKLLVMIVEHIDTLLEDWYPSLGTRFIHTSDGRFLITRIVTCTACMSDLVKKERACDDNAEQAIDVVNAVHSSDMLLSPDASEVDTCLRNFYKAEVKRATIEASSIEMKDIVLEDNTGKDSLGNLSTLSGDDQQHRVYAFMVEECILAVYDDQRVECPSHGRLRMERIAPDVMFGDIPQNLYIEREQLRFGKLLGRGSFGFVFRAFYTPSVASVRSLISSARRSSKTENKITTPTSPKQWDVSNSVFYLPSADQNYEVALKLLQPIKLELRASGARKIDLEAYAAMKSKWQRDPLQFASKAYCAARIELNIMSTLKHPNIASLVGICPKPLSLILSLAPHGSLDIHLKQLRRSGVRIPPLILQQSFLQISKALEYLHQHRIIYRDLKSENVLVWAFPNLVKTSHTHYTQTNQIGGRTAAPAAEDIRHPTAGVQLKLADYGISRSSLPTGTKGFGGTEGFMAPEIMLYNGEEEYTEKVDCFSFAMFMYEMCTLRCPFEGQEFIIRESILDGIRPALAKRDLDILPETFVDLMTRCWRQEPSERPTISQIVSIISAPEFCALRDVTLLAEPSALICAVAFELNNSSSNNNSFRVCLSKVGKQIDCLDGTSSNCKWAPTGNRLACENLDNRTVTSACVVDGNQLWLGDSRAVVHVHELGGAGLEEGGRDSFKLLGMFQIELNDPATMTAIKSICWTKRGGLVGMCLNSGSFWVVSVMQVQTCLGSRTDGRMCFSSHDLAMREILPISGQHILCAAFVETRNDEGDDQQQTIELWCGQPEGKIAVIQLDIDNLMVKAQTIVDHYDDHYVKHSLASSYIGSSVDLADRSVVAQLMSADSFVFSILYADFMVYQWDVNGRQIQHRLDCSKLVPCSESLLSISIEDHFRPGNCFVTAMAASSTAPPGSSGNEVFFGTNTGCIIVAELSSLQPITVCRPHEEVTFIITIDSSKTIEPSSATETDIEPADNRSPSEITGTTGSLKSRASSMLWPFHTKHSKKHADRDKKGKGDKGTEEADSNKQTTTTTAKQIKPFITIGKGYRNLLDRFIATDAAKTLDPQHGNATGTYALVWKSGYWHFA